jgi:hypothetical protein
LAVGMDFGEAAMRAAVEPNRSWTGCRRERIGVCSGHHRREETVQGITGVAVG